MAGHPKAPKRRRGSAWGKASCTSCVRCCREPCILAQLGVLTDALACLAVWSGGDVIRRIRARATSTKRGQRHQQMQRQGRTMRQMHKGLT
eukprot:10562479-Alexandrium_andersonii.AAC.1